MTIDSHLVQKAQALIPSLHESIVRPAQVIEVVRDEGAFQGWSVIPAGSLKELYEKSLGKNDSFVLDFGDHQVGYLTLKLKPTGSPADAPLRLQLIFGEMPCEIGEDFDDYEGWLSRSWLQDEMINIDVLPCEIQLPRRYAFRYVKVIVMETSVKYKVQFEDIYCTAVTSADWSKVMPPHGVPDDLRAMDRIGMKTLADCMQTVFEDGPKRDRRLWIGDLRLQALVNYESFQNFDLVKRCLYLFGGMTLDEGRVGACVFEKPEPHVDDTVLYDYSLFFVATLYDYYFASKDQETLQELWPVAWKQVELAMHRIGNNGIVEDDPTWWCFVDWHPELNKQASAQAILIYCLKRGLALAEAMSLEMEQGIILDYIERLSNAALRELYDTESGFFISGEQRQISWASQVWMVLAEVMNQQDNKQLLERLFSDDPDIRPNTPYMVHHLIEALLVAGNKEKAVEQIKAYWGEMVKDGADTFWEVYNPQDKKLSPYGSNLINSYCHAWSCTPSYFIRKYLV